MLRKKENKKKEKRKKKKKKNERELAKNKDNRHGAIQPINGRVLSSSFQRNRDRTLKKPIERSKKK